MKKIFLFISVSLLISSCNLFSSKEPQTDDDSTGYDLSEKHDSLKLRQDSTAFSTPDKETVLMELTKDILTIFKNQQYAKLDSFIHPTEGVRFSPYAHVSAADKKYSKENFINLVTNERNKKINWGTYDGSGDPIVLTPKEYFNKFVYDANFVNPGQAKVNEIIKTGNTINNLQSFYQGSDFTESHFSGSSKTEGMDWKSVRLVFKQMDGKYYLVGIVHDQWTI